MTVVKLGDVTGTGHPLGSGGPQVYTMTIGGTVLVGSTMIVIGWNSDYSSAKRITSIADTKGNAYVIRAGAVGDSTSPGIMLADAQITTQLVSGDKINVTMTTTDAFIALVAAWFSSCAFDKLAQATWAANRYATGGTITTGAADELILGIFGGYSGGDMNAAAIQTPGPGYTNQPSWGNTINMVDERAGLGVDWESKIKTAPGSETATAEMVVTSYTSRSGATVAYLEVVPNQMMGVV